MGPEKGFVFAAALLILEACSVLGHARVEYLNQPYCTATVTTAPVIQAATQLVVPAIIKPVIQPSETHGHEIAPTVPNFNSHGGFGGGYPPAMPPPMAPIIIEDDDDDWHHILYFLLFALRNRRGGCGGGIGGGCGGACGCGGSCCGNCGGGHMNHCCCGGGCGGSCGGGCGGYNGGGNGGYCPNCGGGCGGCCCGCNGCFGGGSGNSGNCYGGNSGFSFIPYPIGVPMSGPSYGCGYGYDNSGGGIDDGSGYQNGNEINLIIRTDQGMS